MTVAQFLKRCRDKGNHVGTTSSILLDLMTLLDEFDSEACSTLAGKIRSQLEELEESNK